MTDGRDKGYRTGGLSGVYCSGPSNWMASVAWRCETGQSGCVERRPLTATADLGAGLGEKEVGPGAVPACTCSSVF